MASNFDITDRDDGVFVIFRGDKISYSSEIRSQTGMGNARSFGSKTFGNLERAGKNETMKGSSLKVRASAKTKRVVEYPIFDALMNQEQDPYWKSLFDEAATGKFPRNFKFQNGSLHYKIRSKTIEQVVESSELTDSDKDLSQTIQTVKQFFLTTAGILSPEDLRRKKLEEEKRILELMNNEIISWKQIRSEKQKMIMLSLYVETIGKKYGLNIEERKGLVQNIRIGMLAGYFHNDNIIITGNQIEDIEGLCFNEETNEFYIDKESNKPIRPKVYDSTSLHNLDSKSRSQIFQNDTTLSSRDHSGDYDSDSDEESNDSIYTPESFDSKTSSQYEKKKWNRFLSEISKKGK